MTKIELLTILQEKVKACTLCPELVANRTQTVFSDGDYRSNILICAEAPGRNEDKDGIPLIGRAGQLLNNILADNGIDRKDVYICNVLKCRPPNNRTPTEEECTNCSKFLKMQIKIVNPKYIIALGAVAAQHLLKTESPIGRLRGRWYEYKDHPVAAKVLATWHPAYLLRTPAAKADVHEDLQLLLKELKVLA